MADVPLVGPSYNLDSRPASVQRTINLVPVPQEPGNERTAWVLQDVPGLRRVELEEGGGVVTGPVSTPLLLQLNGDFLDSSGNANHYSALGGHSFVPARFSDGVENLGTGSPPGAATTNFTIADTNEAFTIDFWYRAISYPALSSHDLWIDGASGIVRFQVNNVTNYLIVTLNGTVYNQTTGPTVSTTDFQYIRLTRGLAGAVTLTVNGIVVLTFTEPAALLHTVQYRLGNANSFGFQIIDALRVIRNRALSTGAHGIPTSPPTVVTS